MKKGLFLAAVLFVATFGMALSVSAVSISPAIPGMSVSPTTGTPPSSFVAGFYKFALMIGGTLAFGAVVYGGILYAASAGNPGKQSEGREWIKSALFGLLLLAGAYLILYTVNPDIVSLKLPSLPPVNVQVPSAPPTVPVPTSSTPSATTVCGTNGANGQCSSNTDGSTNYCCPNNSGSYACQSTQCSATCGQNGSSGSCANSNGTPQNCCLYQNGQWGCQTSACTQAPTCGTDDQNGNTQKGNGECPNNSKGQPQACCPWGDGYQCTSAGSC